MTNDAWAEVHSNGRVMRYQRWRPGGAVPPRVVVLGPGRLGVIVPDLPDPSWLKGFVEGLGTGGLTILAAGPYYEAALELAALDPERVAGVSPLAG
jgi:hypothetical protein